MTLGKELKELLEEKGMNQTELARLIGVTPTTICRYVNDKGNPNDENLKKIELVFGVKLKANKKKLNEAQKTEFGKKIKDILKKENIRKAEFAKKTGVTNYTVNKFIDGTYNPSYKFIKKVEEEYNTDLEKFYPELKRKVLKDQKGNYFGDELKKLLKERGITQKDLARKIRVEKVLINGYIKKRYIPVRRNLKKIEDALNVRFKGFKVVEETIEDEEACGSVLREKLVEKGMTSQKLAELSGIPATYISKYKTSRWLPQINRAIIIADIFGISLEELSGKEVKNKSAQKRYKLIFCSGKKSWQDVLGINLTKILNAQDISEEKFAKMTGLSLKTIKKIKIGKANLSFKSVKIISKVLNVPIDDLIGHRIVNGYAGGER